MIRLVLMHFGNYTVNFMSLPLKDDFAFWTCPGSCNWIKMQCNFQRQIQLLSFHQMNPYVSSTEWAKGFMLELVTGSSHIFKKSYFSYVCKYLWKLLSTVVFQRVDICNKNATRTMCIGYKSNFPFDLHPPIYRGNLNGREGTHCAISDP